jgi:hypothetical protein
MPTFIVSLKRGKSKGSIEVEASRYVEDDETVVFYERE